MKSSQEFLSWNSNFQHVCGDNDDNLQFDQHFIYDVFMDDEKKTLSQHLGFFFLLL